MLSHASNQASICSSHCFLIPFFEPEIKADDVAIEFISANFAKILLPLWVSRGLRVWSRNSISSGWMWIWWISLLSMFRIPQQHRGDKWMQFSSKPTPNHVNVNQSKTHISAKGEIQPPKSPKCFFSWLHDTAYHNPLSSAARRRTSLGWSLPPGELIPRFSLTTKVSKNLFWGVYEYLPHRWSFSGLSFF